jgi:hypothetical protein
MPRTDLNSLATTASRSKGAHRMREIASEQAAAIREAVAGLLQGLHRQATTADLAAAELIAATMIRARYLRSLGKDDRAERKELAKLLRDSPFHPEPRVERSTEPHPEHAPA